jgi:hypothetical protein
LKTIITNPAILGDSNARIAAAGFSSVTDTPFTIFQRLHDELGALDAVTEAQLKAFYAKVWIESVPVYITDEANVHEIISAQGFQYTEAQRLQMMRGQFEIKGTGATAIRDFDTNHPRPADKTLANFHVWMVAQSLNVMAASVRAQEYPGTAQGIN